MGVATGEMSKESTAGATAVLPCTVGQRLQSGRLGEDRFRVTTVIMIIRESDWRSYQV
jgi:hypothetical protein